MENRSIRALKLKNGDIYYLKDAVMHVEIADHFDISYKEVNHIGYMIDDEFSISPMYLVRPQGD
jgi:hypothetical protein